ncbi:hypothetical protein [Neorhodopirellula pilleata]|uniref:DUF1772 domain-containing protein n=1 Tax=Neorhodopirellula pilleata TaxID=2714738 RepID=A0A5C6AAU9_9BACT|nr:hypothetical protein [Neorhodopirellula pilleata]TWT96556.1 hypothetical protein Pla100_30390 [Neorhodopirellula pilleata]
MLPNALFLLNLLSTWYMVGLIWMVQIVHYKMFDRVGSEFFVKYAVDHSRLITPIVGIPMLIEIATAAGLMLLAPAGVSRPLLGVGLGLILVIWVSTAALQVPCHERLAGGFDAAVYERLVSTNWIRTLAWSVRGGLMGYLCWRLIGQA